jgi:hypothetical protein
MSRYPPKEESRPGRAAVLQKLQLLEAYHAAAYYANLLEEPFWFWESLRGRLADLIENEFTDELTWSSRVRGRE